MRLHARACVARHRLLHVALVPLGGALLALAPLPGVAQPAPAYSGVVTIGVEDGPDALTFGHIADLAVDGDGGVFVLDGHMFELRWFDAAGRHRATVGREGGGPGEFESPSAVAVGADGRVHVLDPGNGRIATFRPVAGRLVHERDVRLPLPATDLCLVGERRFVLVPRQPRVIHELAPAGKIVRSFGEPEQPSADELRRAGHGAAVLRGVVNQGELHCDAARGRCSSCTR